MAAEYKSINIENAKANLDFGSRLDDRLIEKEVQIINLKEKLQKAEAKQSHNLEQDPNYMKLKKTVRLLKQENERLVNQKHADNSQERSC